MKGYFRTSKELQPKNEQELLNEMCVIIVPLVLYEYQRTRGKEHPKEFLAGFKGYLHVDGYAGYNNLPGVTLVGCLAHARRKFDEALKALPQNV